MTHRISPWMCSILLLAACGEDATPKSVPPAVADNAVKKATSEQANAARSAPKTASDILTAGLHSVYGLRMPNGMTPAGSPSEGVFRFEGPHPSNILASFIESQLEPFAAPETESNAVLYRHVTVRKPAGGYARSQLAIRLYAKENGSAVDVWLEKETTAEEQTATSTGAPSAFSTGLSTSSSEKKASPQYASPKERRRAELEMIDKIRRGEKLTEADLDNPLFQ